MTPRPERQRVQVSTTSVSYVLAGTGFPIVLVHGLAGSSRWWSRTIGPLAQQFQVYAVNLAGRPSQRQFSHADASALLLAWLDAVGITAAHLVGHSLGAHVCALLAAEAPERVARLVLADAAIVPYRRRLRDPAVGLARSLGRVPPRFIPVLAGDVLRTGPLRFSYAARALLTSDVRPDLARIQAPTLVVWGERDRLTPVPFGRQIAAAIPNATFALIPRAGHNVMIDQPDAFNHAVVEFLEAK